VEIVDLMDVEDPDVIQSKIEECLISDTGLRRRNSDTGLRRRNSDYPIKGKRDSDWAT
jgi:hypothetical protein